VAAEEFNDGADVTAPLKPVSLVLVPRFTTSAGNFFPRRREWALRVLSPENSDKKSTREMAVLIAMRVILLSCRVRPPGRGVFHGSPAPVVGRGGFLPSFHKM